MKINFAKVTFIRHWLESNGITEKGQYEKVEHDFLLMLEDPIDARLLTLWNSVRELDETCQQFVKQYYNIEPDEEEEIDF